MQIESYMECEQTEQIKRQHFLEPTVLLLTVTPGGSGGPHWGSPDCPKHPSSSQRSSEMPLACSSELDRLGAGQGDRTGRRRAGLPGVTDPYASRIPGPPVFPLLKQGLA